MEIQISRAHGAYVIKLSGRWDVFSAPDFERTCAELIEKDMHLVVIDAAGVDYVSSFGLRSLLNLGKLLEPLQGRLHISSLQPQVRKVFVGSGFSSLFPEYADIATALAAFGKTA